MNKEFFQAAYTLEYTKRYSMSPVINYESVASHSYFVALAVLLLSETYNFDVAKSIKIAIVHDVPEIEISDVNHLVKKNYPKLAGAIKEVEDEVIKKMPRVVEEHYLEYSKSTVEAMIVHLADAMQCSQYAKSEMALGNKGYMDQVLQNSERRVSEITEKLKEYKHAT
tara:strand:+ start:5386 stop:5889 length:504 start_codon:yes stop_codon:yes gene_type:complete